MPCMLTSISRGHVCTSCHSVVPLAGIGWILWHRIWWSAPSSPHEHWPTWSTYSLEADDILLQETILCPYRWVWSFSAPCQLKSFLSIQVIYWVVIWSAVRMPESRVHWSFNWASNSLLLFRILNKFVFSNSIFYVSVGYVYNWYYNTFVCVVNLYWLETGNSIP